MLQVNFGNIITYATQHESMLLMAIEEFFGTTQIDEHMENFEVITGLFNEWLIFDFKMPSGSTFIVDYYLKNPDSLPKEQLEELRQIIETQQFETLELQSVERGKYLKVYGLHSGENYTVYEHRGSLTVPEKGTFWGRIAKVHDKHILVGSDPMFFPAIASPRLKKIYLTTKPDHFSPRDILPLLLPHRTKASQNVEKQMSRKELKKKRASLEEQFYKIQQDNSLSISFEDLVSFIYNENYKDNFADFFADLIKLGIPEKIVFSESDLFNDVWNYFPHKLLNGKSPYEIWVKSNKNIKQTK